MKINRLLSDLMKSARLRHGVRPFEQAAVDLDNWFQREQSDLLRKAEQDLLDQELERLYGYHLLQLSVQHGRDLSTASKINHRFGLGPLEVESAITGACSSLEALPLPSESIDVVLLHHVLEFSQGPHHVLREATRVVIPKGHVVIVGFNPFSFSGLYKYLGQWLQCKAECRRHSLRLGRVIDWLRLLDFEPITVHYGIFRPQISHPEIRPRLSWMDRLGERSRLPLGSIYCIVARKQVIGVTPIKPDWGKLNPIAGLRVTKPSNRAPEVARVIPFHKP